MPIVYSRLDGAVCVIHTSPGHDGWKDVPDGAINAKDIPIENIPQDPEWSPAWVYDGEQIKICLNSAKGIALEEMKKRQEALKSELGHRAGIAMLEEDKEAYEKLRSQYLAVRDAHKSLGGLQISGYNDPAALEKIKELCKLPEIER